MSPCSPAPLPAVDAVSATHVRIEARGKELHFLGGIGPAATDERLDYLGNDTFGFKDTLLLFRRDGGAVSSVRLDTVAGNVRLVRAKSR